VNSIVWANTVGATDNSETAQILKQSATIVNLNYSCVQNLTGLLGGIGNSGMNPMFVDPVLDSTLHRDLRLLAGSPSVDVGSNAAVPPTMLLDLDGNPRVVDGDRNGTATVDLGAYEFQPPLLLAMDIKPGGCPNSFNINSNGVLPVALLGSADLDVTQVNLASVHISRVDEVGEHLTPHEGPPGPHTTIEDVATPFTGPACACHDFEGDGFLDLSLKFKSADLVAALELNSLTVGALVPLVLNGELLDGTAFVAYDCVRLIPPGTPPGLLNVSSNAAGVWLDVTPPDNYLESGGFAMFERTFPLGSVVQLTAPAKQDGRSFAGWKVNGVLQKWKGLGYTIVVLDPQQTITALYEQAVTAIETSAGTSE
jgi:hypothetical protein